MDAISAMLSAADASDDPLHAIQCEAIEQSEGDIDKGLRLFEKGRAAWLEQRD